MRAPLFTGLVFSLVLGFSDNAEATSKRHYNSCDKGRSRAVVVVTAGQTTSVQSSSCPPNGGPSYSRPTYSRPSYGYRHYRGYRRSYAYRPYYAPAPVYYYNPAPTYTPAPAPVRPTYDRVAEVGVRALAGGTEGAAETIAGVGAYARVRRNHLGLEASIDSAAVLNNDGKQVAARVPVLGAAMLYLNPQSPLRVYGLVGGGLSFQQTPGFTSEIITVQAGAGLDIDISPRASLNLDVRGLQDLESQVISDGPAVQAASNAPSAFVTGNVGVSLRF
jgi:hypothetical protein